MRIAVDTGGTFTDCVFLRNGKLEMLKVFSTPADPGEHTGHAGDPASPHAVLTRAELTGGLSVAVDTVAV